MLFANSSKELKKLEKSGGQIHVAIIGAGWFGSGLIQELAHWPGLIPKVVFARSVEKTEQRSHLPRLLLRSPDQSQ